MQIKINKKQMKSLSKYDELLTDLGNDKYVGIILSKKQEYLGLIYDELAPGRCSSCNNNWIRRLAKWYIENKKK